MAVEKGDGKRLGVQAVVLRPRIITTILEEGAVIVDVSESVVKGGVDVKMNRENAIIAVAISRIAHEMIQLATSRVDQGQKLENSIALFGMLDLEPLVVW